MLGKALSFIFNWKNLGILAGAFLFQKWHEPGNTIWDDLIAGGKKIANTIPEKMLFADNFLNTNIAMGQNVVNFANTFGEPLFNTVVKFIEWIAVNGTDNLPSLVRSISDLAFSP